MFRFHKAGACFQFLLFVFLSWCTPCQHKKNAHIHPHNLNTFTVWNKIIIWMLIFFSFFCNIQQQQQKIKKPKDKNEPSSLNYTIRNSKFIHIGCIFFYFGVLLLLLLMMLLLLLWYCYCWCWCWCCCCCLCEHVCEAIPK